MIELNRLCVGYGNHEVLREVSAAFEKGQLTSVIGVNGSGKSTLLKAILAMVPPGGGNIRIDGRDIKDMSRSEIARRAAYLSQGKNTPDMTVEQMVLHGRFPHLGYPRRYGARDREIALAAMEQAGVAELARKPLHALSGGMRQNAYIAMALAQDTPYVLLDEPTTYLDIAHQLALMETLRRLADGGRGVVAVLHDLPLAFTFSDRIVLLSGGRVIGDDAPGRLWEGKLLEEVFGVGLAPSPAGQGYSYTYPSGERRK